MESRGWGRFGVSFGLEVAVVAFLVGRLVAVAESLLGLEGLVALDAESVIGLEVFGGLGVRGLFIVAFPAGLDVLHVLVVAVAAMGGLQFHVPLVVVRHGRELLGELVQHHGLRDLVLVLLDEFGIGDRGVAVEDEAVG
jgi:hypothetical protein